MGGYSGRNRATTTDAISTFGEEFELGDHLLICGDAADIHDHVIPGQTLVYDPPWDDEPHTPVIEYASGVADGDQLTDEWPSVIAFADGQTIGNVFTLFGAPTWVFTWDTAAPWNISPAHPLKQTKLAAWYGREWDRDAVLVGAAPHAKNHPGTVFDPVGGRRLTDLWRQSLRWHHAGTPHPHMKPLGWVRALLGNGTKGPVVDPYAGSGQVMFAADQLGRPSVNIELDEHCCDIIRARWTLYCRTLGNDPGRDGLDPALFPDLCLDVADQGGHVASLKKRSIDEGATLFQIGGGA